MMLSVGCAGMMAHLCRLKNGGLLRRSCGLSASAGGHVAAAAAAPQHLHRQQFTTDCHV